MATQKKKSNSLSLNCYFIKFTEKETSKPVIIKDVFGKDGFKKSLEHFEKAYTSYAYVNDAEDRMLYLNNRIQLSDSLYAAIMKKGHNGEETDIDELQKGKPKTVNNVKAEQFNSSYFYFLISLPNPKSPHLIFISQSQGSYGFKDLFAESFKQYIETIYTNKYLVSFNPITSPTLFQKYIEQGDIRQIKFVRYTLPENIENILGNEGNHILKDFQLETTIKAKKNGINGIKKFDFSNSSFVEAYNVSLGFEYQSAFAEVTFNGRKRVMNIMKPDKFVASYDVSDSVPLDSKTKKPDFKILHIEALKILKEEILSI